MFILTLSLFEFWIFLVDHIEFAFAAYDLYNLQIAFLLKSFHSFLKFTCIDK